jgi:D-glycero-D-manno-heptose 1,7-bisphosphate phosphatase
VAVRAPISAVFLDKDGTLLVDEPYNVDPARMRLEAGAEVALRRLGTLRVPLIVVSNQPGVALGMFEPNALSAVEQRLRELFAENGAKLTACYFCPHHPEGSVDLYAVACDCRKPLPGLIHRAAAEHGIDLAHSWMIGDILDDVEAGNRAGCRTIMVDNGHETQWSRTPATRRLRTAHIIVPNLDVASRAIVGQVRVSAGQSTQRLERAR